MRQQAIQNQFAANENDKLKALLAFRDGPRFPSDYTGLAAAVIARPTGGFAQDVVVAVGSNDGVALDAPVVTEDGFLGRVTRVYSRSARVTLLTDEQLAVSALDVKSGASGIVKHGRASASTLIFDRVPKKLKVSVGDTIVTAGWRSSKLASLYPRGIPIGRVTSVGQADTDLWKQVQVEPFADFDRVDAVLVLVRKDGAARERVDGGEDRADRVPRRDPAGVGVLGDLDRRRRARPAARHPRCDRAAPRLDHRSRRRASSPG